MHDISHFPRIGEPMQKICIPARYFIHGRHITMQPANDRQELGVNSFPYFTLDINYQQMIEHKFCQNEIEASTNTY